MALRALQAVGLHHFLHLTHIDNLPSILEHGLLPLRELTRRGLNRVDISLGSAQERREDRRLQVGPDAWLGAHEMVPLFLRSKTPMLSSRREMIPSLCFVLIDARYICRDEFRRVITDGNLASPRTRDRYTFRHLHELPWDVLDAEYWVDFEDGSRKRGAELLVAPNVPPPAFLKVVVPSPDALRRAAAWIVQASADLACESHSEWFF